MDKERKKRYTSLLDIILLPYDRHASIRIMKQTKSYFMIDVFNRKFVVIAFPFETLNRIYENYYRYEYLSHEQIHANINSIHGISISWRRLQPFVNNVI